MNTLDISNVSVSYPSRLALDGVSASLKSGQIAGVMGPNGGGKTTLLKCIAGILSPDEGKIEWGGSDAHSGEKSLSYIPQRGEIDWDFPITVEQVVAMGVTAKLPFYKGISAQLQAKIDNALRTMGMWDLKKNHIRELSGGQQQRMFLARALAQNADLFLLDEPFNGLDAKATDQLIEQLRSLASSGVAVVLVHHELSNASSILDSVLLLNQKVIAQGRPEDVLSDANLSSVYGRSFKQR